MDEPEKTDDLPALIAKARGGSGKAADEVRKRYADRPEKLLDLVDPMEVIARRQVAGIVTEGDKPNPLTTDVRLAHMEAMQARVAGPNPSPIEALLASRVATCWAETHAIEAIFAVASNSGDSTRRTVEHLDKLLTRAHDRLMKALKMLAYVRRVELTVMLNQVHNTGPTQ